MVKILLNQPVHRRCFITFVFVLFENTGERARSINPPRFLFFITRARRTLKTNLENVLRSLVRSKLRHSLLSSTCFTGFFSILNDKLQVLNPSMPLLCTGAQTNYSMLLRLLNATPLSSWRLYQALPMIVNVDLCHDGSWKQSRDQYLISG